MKNLRLTILCLSFLSLAGLEAQNFSDLSLIPLETAEDHLNAEPRVLECAEYLLSHPLMYQPMTRGETFTFLFQWMEGTPDFVFTFDEEAVKMTENEDDLIIMYFVSLARAALESEDRKIGKEEMQAGAKRYLFAYCAKEENGLEPSKKMKKMMKKGKS